MQQKTDMAKTKNSLILVAFFVLLIATEGHSVQADGNGNGNGNGKGNGNGNSNGNGDGSNISNGNGNSNTNGNGGSGSGNGNDNDNDNGNGNGNGNDNDNSNGNGNGNSGSGDANGNGNGNGNGNDNGNGNGNGNDNGSGQGNGKGEEDCDYNVEPIASGEERAHCKAKGSCYDMVLVCPNQCPHKKPKNNKKQKGCHFDCSSKCEATYKNRKPNCDGYGSLCYNPRFIGGDGRVFYFHGSKGGNFAVVSDDTFQINAHFIGTRPEGRTCDYTWVQALSVMFATHNLIIAARRVSYWDDNVDSLVIRWDGDAIYLPTNGDEEWKTTRCRGVLVERTDDTNSLSVKVSGLVEMDIRVRPIGKEENRVHNYQLPDDDSFAHLETQFRFMNLSDLVEGILGKTYRPDYASPVKRGVPMPLMGGEDKYQTPSLLSPLCMACSFRFNLGFAATI